MSLVPEGYSEINPSIYDDVRLSFRAVGVLVHLLVQPANKPITVADVRKRENTREGRDAIRLAMRELEAAGYLRRGQGTNWVWNGDPAQWVTRAGEHSRWSQHAG